MIFDVMAAFEDEPPPLDFVFSGFLAGTVGALVAPGATGKSFWSLEAAAAVACSVAGGDMLGLKPQKTGRVLYIAGEDPPIILWHRFRAMGATLEPLARAHIAQNLTVKSVLGQRFNIMDELKGDLETIIALASDTRLIIIDTLSRIHTLDENSNSEMAQLVSTLEYIATQTGAAVLFLHHVSKGSARDGQVDQQQAARGASSLIDNARWCGYVSRMTSDESERLSEHQGGVSIGTDRRGFYVRFGVSKQNYSAETLDQWYERGEGGILLPVGIFDAYGGNRSTGNTGNAGTGKKSNVKASY
jgi:RecA-family ATPase